MKPYFTLRGSEADGYSLMMYKYVGECVSTYWSTAKEFDTLVEAVAAIDEAEASVREIE